MKSFTSNVRFKNSASRKFCDIYIYIYIFRYTFRTAKDFFVKNLKVRCLMIFLCIFKPEFTVAELNLIVVFFICFKWMVST